MSCCGPIIIGATCDDRINYGETIDIGYTYTNEDGSPIDLTSASVSIVSSTPQAIMDKATVTITDAPNGVVRFLLLGSDALELRRGVNNRFRMKVVFGPESDSITEYYLQVS